MENNSNRDLIRAIERNTSAVRSIAIFVIWQFAVLILGSIFIGIGVTTASEGWSYLGLVTIVVGLLVVLGKSLEELNRS